MNRSLFKGPYVHPSIFKKMSRTTDKDKLVIRTWSRSSTILPSMIGILFQVHNGKSFDNIKVDVSHVGHKLGEFSQTRKFLKHSNRKQAQKTGYAK